VVGMMLSIVIPAYNEEKRILKTLEDYYTYFRQRDKNSGYLQKFEIIVVCNNCSDKTFQVVKKYRDSHPSKNNIILINIPWYTGKGGAVMAGFAKAKGEMVGFTDADNSTRPHQFMKLVNVMKHKKKYAVIASRRMKDSEMVPARSLMQNASSFLFNYVVNQLFDFGIIDTQCGAKLFSKDIAQLLVEDVVEEGWIFDVDMIYLCTDRYKVAVEEVPVRWHDADGSHLSTWAGIKAVWQLIQYKKLRTKSNQNLPNGQCDCEQ
jgi:glycosyltransferase involved in cell wall biosynthesis